MRKHLPFLQTVLLYSLSAFGGPQGQFGMMIKSFVDKGKFITLPELINLNAFCQVLPGATATQTITLLGYRQGGLRIAFLTLILWTCPAVILMSLLSFLFSSSYFFLIDHLRFISPMVLGFLAFAAINTYRLINTGAKWLIVFFSTIITFLLFKTPWVFPIVLLCGGLFSYLFISVDITPYGTSRKKLSFTPFIIFAFLFLAAGFLSETARKKSWEFRTPYNVFENMYRFGSIVFGGADVLIPVMYNQYVVRPQTAKIKRTNSNAIAIKPDAFLSAAGVVRALPGPAFSISSFIGGMAMNDRGWSYQVLGCLLAATGIFLPTFLLSIFFYPLWENIQQFRWVNATMIGINAAVVGIMTASIFYLFRDTFIFFVEKPMLDIVLFFSVFLITFYLLYHTKVPAPIIALGCFFLGFL